MRKIIISITALLIFIVSIILLFSLLLGFAVQKHYPELLTRISQNSSVDLKLLEYHRGWFSSRAVVQISLSPEIITPQQAFMLSQHPRTQWTIDQKIIHGPIIWAKLMDGSYRLWLGRAAAENNVNDANTQLQTFTLWTFTNQVKTLAKASHLTFDNGVQRIIGQHLNARINYIMNNRRLLGHATLAQLKLSKVISSNQEEKLLTLQQLNTNSDLRYHTNGLWYGSSQTDIGNLIIYPDPNQPIMLTRLNLFTRQIAVKNRTQIMIHSHIQQVKQQALQLDHIKFRLLLTGLNSIALGKLNQAVTHNRPIYIPLFNLLEDGFTVLHELYFNTQDGPVSLTSNIHFPGQAPEDNNPLYWFQAYKKINIHAQLRVPPLWLNRWLANRYQGQIPAATLNPTKPEVAAQQQINYWLSHDIIEKQENQFVIRLQLKDGQLLINGTAPDVKDYLVNRGSH